MFTLSQQLHLTYWEQPWC